MDFQKGNALVSLKTVDPGSATAIERMEAHIDDLATRGATVDGMPANMTLDIRVPSGSTGSLTSLISYGSAQEWL